MNPIKAFFRNTFGGVKKTGTPVSSESVTQSSILNISLQDEIVKVQSMVQSIVDGNKLCDDAELLETMKELAFKIEGLANGYPRNPIVGDVWMSGAALAELGRKLVQHYKMTGEIDKECFAGAIWAKSTLSVCSHYHHMVGPAIVENADCNARMGNNSRADSLYGSVVADFVVVLDEVEEDGVDSASEEQILALHCLLKSLKWFTDKSVARYEGHDIGLLAGRVMKIIEAHKNIGIG